MAQHKVNHNVIKPFSSQSVAAKSGSTAGTATSEWIDVNGWTDKRISAVAAVTDGSGSLSMSYEIQISPKHYYELNQLGSSVSTVDYEAVTVNASALTVATLTSYDAEDIDELQRPFRSCRVKASNGDASDASTVNLWIEGWS